MKSSSEFIQQAIARFEKTAAVSSPSTIYALFEHYNNLIKLLNDPQLEGTRAAYIKKVRTTFDKTIDRHLKALLAITPENSAGLSSKDIERGIRGIRMFLKLIDNLGYERITVEEYTQLNLKKQFFQKAQEARQIEQDYLKQLNEILKKPTDTMYGSLRVFTSEFDKKLKIDPQKQPSSDTSNVAYYRNLLYLLSCTEPKALASPLPPEIRSIIIETAKHSLDSKPPLSSKEIIEAIQKKVAESCQRDLTSIFEGLQKLESTESTKTNPLFKQIDAQIAYLNSLQTVPIVSEELRAQHVFLCDLKDYIAKSAKGNDATSTTPMVTSEFFSLFNQMSDRLGLFKGPALQKQALRHVFTQVVEDKIDFCIAQLQEMSSKNKRLKTIKDFGSLSNLYKTVSEDPLLKNDVNIQKKLKTLAPLVVKQNISMFNDEVNLKQKTFNHAQICNLYFTIPYFTIQANTFSNVKEKNKSIDDATKRLRKYLAKEKNNIPPAVLQIYLDEWMRLEKSLENSNELNSKALKDTKSFVEKLLKERPVVKGTIDTQNSESQKAAPSSSTPALKSKSLTFSNPFKNIKNPFRKTPIASQLHALELPSEDPPSAKPHTARVPPSRKPKQK